MLATVKVHLMSIKWSLSNRDRPLAGDAPLYTKGFFSSLLRLETYLQPSTSQMRWILLFTLDTENKKWPNQNQYPTLINDAILYIPFSHNSLHAGSSKLPCHHFRRPIAKSPCPRNDSGSHKREACREERHPGTSAELLHRMSASAHECMRSTLDGRFPKLTQVRPCYSYHTQNEGKEDMLLQISAFADYFYWLVTLHLRSFRLDGNFMNSMLKPM